MTLLAPNRELAMISHRGFVFAAIAAMSLAPRALPAQASEVDRGMLIVMRGSETVGREEFVVHRGRGSGVLAGFTIMSTAWYPAERPERSLSSVVEVGTDSVPSATRLEAGNGDPKRVLIGLGPRRITVRSATSSGESAREYPFREPHVLVDDSLFAAHAFPPVARNGTARTLTLEGIRGPLAEIVDHGTATTLVGNAARQLHHLSIVSPSMERHLWYDSAGQIVKVEDPSRGLTVIRASEEGG
jgi:hypothetical protein